MKLEKQRTARGGISSTSNNNVYISERRIIVSANNTWKNICEDTYVSMSPPNERGISQSGGSLTLKNFICHPLVSLVFKIEYKAVLPSDSANESAYFTLGWTFHVPTYNAAGGLADETMECDVELGPGSVPTGELLWDPNADDINHYNIKMKALISTSSVAPQSSLDSPTNKKRLTTNLPAMHGNQV